MEKLIIKKPLFQQCRRGPIRKFVVSQQEKYNYYLPHRVNVSVSLNLFIFFFLGEPLRHGI